MCVCTRQHTSAHVCTRLHTSAHVCTNGDASVWARACQRLQGMSACLTHARTLRPGLLQASLPRWPPAGRGATLRGSTTERASAECPRRRTRCSMRWPHRPPATRSSLSRGGTPSPPSSSLNTPSGYSASTALPRAKTLPPFAPRGASAARRRARPRARGAAARSSARRSTCFCAHAAAHISRASRSAARGTRWATQTLSPLPRWAS